jgi:outer membrane lipoprotein-sorting protein
MRCDECREKLVEYIEGLLPDQETQQIKSHLGQCSRCRTELDQLTALGQRLMSDAKNRQSADVENRVVNRIICEQNKQLKQAAGMDRQLQTWRIIMKRTVKFAVAAVIIMAVMIGIKMIGGSFDGASVAWAQVVEQINSHTRYKYRQKVVRSQGPQIPTMRVYHLNLSQRRQELEDGTIHIIDMREEDAITVELNPAQKKAVVTKLIGSGPRKDPDIIDMVRQFEQKSTERLGTRKLNGQILHGFRHQPNEYNDFTVWVDEKTKLPVEIELKHPQAKQTIFMDEFDFDFKLDPSAFSTVVPEGFEIKTITEDYRPVESKEIAAETIRKELDRTAYTVKELPWMKKLIILQMTDPLTKVGKVYVIGIQSDDENTILIVQGNYYDSASMVWIPQQQLVLETKSGVKLYSHPNGSLYAQAFLESFSKANPEFFDIKNLSQERLTRMIVMPNGTVLGLAANKSVSNEKLEELVDSLIEVQAK